MRGLHANSLARRSPTRRSPGSTHGIVRRAYYLPTGSDRMVAAFRRWLEGPGGDGPWGAPLAAVPDSAYPPEITERRSLLDRHAQHVRECRSCQRADAWMARLGTAAAAAAAAAWAAAAFLAASASGGAAAALRGRQVLGLLAAGAVLWLARWVLAGLRQNWFHWSDYVHSEHL